MQPGQTARRYLENQVRSANQPQLLVMLIDGALRFCGQAREKLFAENIDIEAIHHALVRAQKIIIELMASLPEDVGQELYTNLMKLYGFVYQRLVQANLKREVEVLDEATAILTSLRDTWAEAIRLEAERSPTSPPRPIPKNISTATSRVSLQG